MYFPYSNYEQASMNTMSWIALMQSQQQCSTLQQQQYQLEIMQQQLNAYGCCEIYGGFNPKPIAIIEPLKRTNCINCGAPLKYHLCEYCGTNNI